MHCRTGPAYPHDRAYTLSCRLFSTSTIYYTIGKKKTQLFFCSLQKIQTSPGLPAPKPRLCRRSALHPALIDSILGLGFMGRCTPPNPQNRVRFHLTIRYAGRCALYPIPIQDSILGWGIMGRCTPPNPRGSFLARERNQSSPGRPRPPFAAISTLGKSFLEALHASSEGFFR